MSSPGVGGDSVRGESDSAVQLFLSWVEEHGEARGPAFDELCAQHPDLRPRLIAIGALHEHARELLEDPPAEPELELPSAPENALAGTRYEPRGEIARGGMGTILEAYDPSLRRTVAAKVLRLRPGAQSSPSARARHRSRFLAEAQILAQLDHPGVVPLYEAGQDERGEPFFTMKRVDGEDFLSVIRAYHAGDAYWRLPRAVRVLKRVSDAVAYAHEKGVIHRDLKPANVMVGRFGEVFVMDWGLAKVIAPSAGPLPAAKPADAPAGIQTERTGAVARKEETEHGAVLGTPAYMAPEQASGAVRTLDARTDVYALGTMLYQLLAGRAPHTDPEESPGVVRGTPEPLARVARRAPEELVAICEKAMAPRPEARYPSAVELANELDAWLEGRVVRSHRTGAWVELRKWVGRNRGAALAVATLVVGLGAIALVQAALRGELAERARELRREDAQNRVALASAALSNGDIAHMQAFLAGCPEDLRGWEWRYLARAADTSAHSFPIEDLELNDVHLRDDPPTLVVAGTGTPTRVEIRDPVSGRRLRSLELPEGHSINSVSFSADGARLAAFGRLGALALWDTRDWSRLPDLNVPLHGWHGVAFAPRGRLLAAYGTEGVQLWDADARTRLATLSAGQEDIADVSWSPDGTRLCAASWDGSVSVWDPRRGRLVELLRVTEARMEQVEWSPDGRWIAGGDWDSRVHVWDARTLRRLHRSDRLEGHVLALAWSPDSGLLAVGGHGVVIHVLEAGSWESVGRLIGHSAAVRAIAFAPGGLRLASVSSMGIVRLWDLDGQGWRTERRLGELQSPAGVAFAPDGARVAVGWEDGSVEIWDPRTRASVQRFACPTGVRHVDWSRGAPRLALASWKADVFVYDAERPTTPRRFAVTEPTEAHFDPRGTLLAVVAEDGTVRVFDAESGNTLWNEAVPIERDVWPGGLFGASWSPDGTELVTGAQGGRIQVRDAFRGELRRQTVRPGMLFAQFSGDGRHVLVWAYERNQGMELLDAATLEPLWRSGQTNHKWPVPACGSGRVFSANWQGLLGVWDLSDGRLLAEIEALPPGNPRLAVAPDGGCVVLAVGGRVGFIDAGPETARR